MANAPISDKTDLAMMPLYVDLDGTLVHSDMAQEMLIKAATRPMAVLRVIGAARADGIAGIKRAAGRETELRADLLPYDAHVLDYVRTARAAGRRIVLATAADSEVAQAIAAHLGVFDAVLATGPGANLKGDAKREAIDRDCDGAPFEYLGNSGADIPIWQAAARAGFVRPTRAARDFASGYSGEKSVDIAAPMTPARGILKAMRPKQWAKNLLVFLPLLFSHRYGDMGLVGMAFLAFVAFSFLASGVYLINDLIDIDDDRAHPTKNRRPFAAGIVTPGLGVGAALALVAGALLFGLAALGPGFGLVLLIYFAMTTAYTFWLKQFSTIDVIFLSLLYTIRIVAGAVATGVALSSWLLTFSLFFFVSLAYMKRFIELQRLNNADVKLPTRNYSGSEVNLVFTFGIANASICLLTLAQYITSAGLIEIYRTPDLLWIVVPLMMFWLYRAWMWASRGKIGDDPVLFAMTDWISFIVLGLVILTILAARYAPFGELLV